MRVQKRLFSASKTFVFSPLFYSDYFYVHSARIEYKRLYLKAFGIYFTVKSDLSDKRSHCGYNIEEGN